MPNEDRQNNSPIEFIIEYDGWRDIGSVSYTHLDVYKRQMEMSWYLFVKKLKANMPKYCQ